jgi:hypothetical protein
MRGTALGNAGEIHSVQMHNFLDYNHQDTAFVTSEDALKFKYWMGSDMVDYQRSKPYYPMHYDRDQNFMKDRAYWLVTFPELNDSYCIVHDNLHWSCFIQCSQIRV